MSEQDKMEEASVTPPANVPPPASVPDSVPDDPPLLEETDNLLIRKHPLPPQKVINGLKLKQKDYNLPFKTYDYTPAIIYDTHTVTGTDWYLLSAYDIVSDHIRIHELREGDDLLACTEEYQRDHAKAVILINTNDTAMLTKEMTQSLHKLDNFIVAVLPFSEGSSLLDTLQVLFEDDELFAKLDVISSETAPLAILGEDSDTAVLERMDPSTQHSQMSVTKGDHKGFMKFFTSRSSLFDLKAEIKKIMFDSRDQMLPVTSDAGLFTMLMANFSHFEKLGKSDVLQIGEVIKRFNRYLEASFHHEFPFFLILIYRLNKFRNLYDCEELPQFIKKCIELFEISPAHQIVQTLQLFLDKKDFDVMFGHEEASSSVFVLLATACKYLLNLSMQLKNSRPNNIATKRIMYCRLLWISVHLKCLSEKGTVTRSDITIWDKSLVQVSKKVVMTKEVIEDLQLGLEFETLLALPQEHQFTIHHLGCLLADDKFIRPFSHVRDVIVGLQEFIKTERELLVHIMINLRAHYTGFLQSTDTTVISRASVEGTILGTLDEGISLLDSVTELWNAKKWNKEDQNKDFRAECLKWMMLLLGAVCLTDSNAPQLLKKFLSPKRGSIIVDKEYRNHIVQSILEGTKKRFPELTVQQFFPLYKAYRIWPIPFLHDFLKQYRIPVNVNITDASWSEFFSEVLQRHSNEELQNYVLDFIIRVAASYRKNQRAHDFIPDVLQFKVINLFDTKSEIDESQIEDKFSDFLKEYICRNNLRPVIMKRIQEIIGLVSDDKETRFHWIILNVLRTEVIPELKSLQDGDKESTKQFKDLLKVSVNTVTQKVSWFGDLTPRHRFCWGVISAGCNKLPMSVDTFEWIFPLQSVVSQLGFVFNVYCKSRHLLGQACLLTEQLPQEITNCKCEDISNYFQWVQKVQNILQKWQKRFLETKINYDEILMYASNSVAINSLGQAVCASEYLMEPQDIEEVKKTFIICFEQLNCYLIRYVANYPEAKYCNLPKLLRNYGVNFPSEIEKSIETKVIFPGNDRTISADLKLSNPIAASTNGQFEPGQEVALIITKAFLLYDLQKLLEDISQFLEPIIDHMEMLVFFHLYKSEMFKKHLHKRLNDISIAPISSPKSGRSFSLGLPSMRPSLAFGMRDKTPKDEGLTMKIFQKALNGVRELLLKILKGTATYSDIIADGALQLESLNMEEEFGILRKFSDLFEMNRSNCEGLDGIKSILELFQFNYHIDQIRRVCEQYGLQKCLEDNSLKTLIMIVEEFETENSRAKLTPIDATDKMAYIKEALCLEERTNYNCLELFPAVSDSAAFYQFIKDKQFVGHKGQTLFREQYQLITAQLQHEEYDENVLNHLRAAFEFIAPFMEANISFHDLMSKVAKLDATNGLKQLKTVNENITLITLWFSRAEGDTLENVANELQHILKTGIYQFELATDSKILLIYQTMQAVRTHRRTGSNAMALEESGEGVNGTKLHITLPTVYPSPLPSMDKKEELFANTIGSIEQCWNNEQIADFVRKLGFLDTKKEGGDAIRQFLHLNSTANKLMELFLKLYELGHPHYQKDRRLQPLLCGTAVVEADEMVADLQRTLIEWRNQVDTLRRQYTWLLFFSVPKALHLFSLLDELELDYNHIVQEVSFLFENIETARNKLKEVIKEAIGETLVKIGTNTPMEFLGEFLQFVCGSVKLKEYLLKEKISDRARSLSMSKHPSHLSITSPTASCGPFGVFQLHYAPGYTQCQIIRLITRLYDGAPECFEVLQCRPTTTAEELSLFMERVKHHPLCYLVLLVNKLPYKLQELLMTLLKNISLPDQPQNGGITNGGYDNGSYGSTVHFIETSPSVLREVPFITYREYKGDDPGLTFEEASRLCRKSVLVPSDFNCIQLIYGYAGDGKTHYIRQQLSKSRATLSISVNEAFTSLNAIQSLKTLPSTATECAIFFNFTIYPHVDETQGKDESDRIAELTDTIGWFFYHFLVLGYIEDPTTGASYRFPGGQEWAVYIEVPSLDRSHKPEESLRLFNVEIPIVGLLGSRHRVHSNTPYTIDKDVQLVCKYLRAYQIGGVKGIDRLYRDGNYPGYPMPPTMANRIVKFSDETDLSADECHMLLQKYMPDHITETKITQKLFISYMKRRCDFLENNPAFNYNTGAGEILVDEQGKKVKTDTRQLGSTIMRTMLEEVSDFCDPDRKKNWSSKSHQQLIYDGGSFGLVSLQPESMAEDRRKEYKKIGFKIHSTSELQRRNVLDVLLSRALDLPFQAENKPLSAIDDCNYVLTLDYTIKMLNIHERYSSGVPVIIKGETGVGKTALVDMLSQLWNSALLHIWTGERGRIIDAIRDLMSIKVDESLENYQLLFDIVSNITAGKNVTIDDLITLGQLNDRDKNKGKFYNRLREILLDMEMDPAIALLKTPIGDKGQYMPINGYFEMARRDHSAHGTAVLLQAVLRAKIKTTFHKMNVHAALTPNDIKKFFVPVFEQANSLRDAYENADDIKKAKINKMPFVTVFLDEVNTSSCLGLFKEIIVDKTLDGEAIPDNVFLVAACNPHRGDSMATHTAETWLRSSYYVRPLHPTLEYLMWDYGSLDQYQEGDYIRAKMKMLHKELPNMEIVTLTDLIVESQSLMRRYALRQLTNQKMAPEEAKVSSQSCVSQRDIQRVFTFYQWLMNMYSKLKQHGDNENLCSRRAVMVSLGIVYYMRLNSEYRQKYEEKLNSKVKLPGEVNFSQAFNEELDFFCDSIELPSGIAKTRALKENLFATIVCTITHTPLVIVGAPGSSKTLSFNLTIANLKGPESRMEQFRDVKIFKSLDPHYYQCSRRTTSNEIQTVFSRAINRQRSHTKFSLPIYCVVLMDEAGLPEESHESLKILHYHLDKQEVSFVAITNHVLDAAKTNRAVSLFRPEVSEKDLETLAKGCLCTTPDQPPANIKQDLNTIVRFCPAYSRLMVDTKLKRFFGLRDFIHFINYLRRHRTSGINHQLVMEALERNFNGIYWNNKMEIFEAVCKSFLNCMPVEVGAKVKWRSTLEVLKESLDDHPEGGRDENEVRYKLIIDPTEDNSLMHLLIAFGVLKRDKTRIYVCSDFPGDSHIQKINTIAAIRHSAIEGHTVVMSQTDDIHESFYDLFNQRFRRIDDPKHGPRYYANIAIGSHLRPCRVHPDFVCVVVVKQTEIDTTPAPFLNRFEKYCISHETLLSTALNHLKPCVRIMLQIALKKVDEFIEVVGSDNNTIYGLKSQTTVSLLLSILPPYGHAYEATPPGEPISNKPSTCLLHELLRALRNSAGFAIPPCSVEELVMDAAHIFPLLEKDASFEAALQTLTIDSANNAVSEAIQVLHTAPDPNEEGVASHEMSQEACLVVSILQQWLIRYLCKTLMQLMTPEAICLHRKKIPGSLIDNYLTHQQHFSLKKLLEHHLIPLQSSDSNTYQCLNKLLCFTRSSSIIHYLPSIYPNPGSFKSHKEEDTYVKELVYDNPTLVQLCQIVSVQSQTTIQETIRDFTQSNRKVLVLLANMQEATTEMVNHLRVMIEEAEFQTTPTSKKLFVLLLHFPPTMFFDSCYPSLFLRGWNHYYLDSIGHCPSLHPGQLDIEEWLQRCCFPNQEFHEDSLMEGCNHLLKQVLPALTSHVSYGTHSNGPFTRPMKASERSAKLKELLWDKGLGPKLCQMFRSCWTPPIMTDYLERAAKFTQTRESSLNITDAVQTMFHSAFTDFMVVMVTKINSERNLDILFTANKSVLIEELFLALTSTVSLPKLAQLKTLAGNMARPKPQIYQPSFPYFSMVYKSMDQLIEDSRRIKGNQDNLFEEQNEDDNGGGTVMMTHSVGPEVEMRDLGDLMLSTIEDRLNEKNVTHTDPIFITLTYINEHADEIWNAYFTDLINHTLHLNITTSPLSREVIYAYFDDLLCVKPLERFVLLHVYFEYNKVGLAGICSLLRPLEKIWEVAADSPHSLGPSSSSSPATDFINVVRQSNVPFGDPLMLSKFVISALFSALVGSVFPKGIDNVSTTTYSTTNILKLWYRTYQRVMSMTALRTHLYSIPIPLYEEAQFNILHATYSLIHVYPQIDEDVLITAVNMFSILLQKYFKADLQLIDPNVIPCLSECCSIGETLISDNSHDTFTDNSLRLLYEELFEHFLGHKRGSISVKDTEWFLRLANTQYMWKASTQLVNETVISSSYSEDLLGAMQKSLNRSRARVVLNPSVNNVSMAFYKRHLSQLLGYANHNDNDTLTNRNPLMMYKPEIRKAISDILSDTDMTEEPCSYIPTFYQDCTSTRGSRNSENLLMQQPLCHLYFATLMEHLMDEPREVNSLVRLADTISQLARPQSVAIGDKILLQIEKQAVIQCLLREVATIFADNTNQVLVAKELRPVITELNDLLNDDSTGGGAISGHRLTLGMHLLHKLKSHANFIDLFTERYHFIKEVQCLSLFHEQLRTQTKSKSYLFPFMQAQDNSSLSKLYTQMKMAMISVHDNKGSLASIDQLVKIAEECFSSKTKTQDKFDRRQAFKMVLWLVTYHEFFAKKIPSQPLCLAIGQKLKKFIKEEGVIRLLQCFLKPRCFIESKELPTPLREDAPVLKILPNGTTVRIDYDGEKADPLYDLFIPGQLGESDEDLRHCLANLVGVVLGCQPQSCHLWYHLFSPYELKDTYMTGFMYNSKISPDGLLYDCGVELTPDGQYGRPDYHTHATRGTYSLHSLYFLLWANFGAFCVSMLTQTNSQSKIHGSIISDWQAIRHYCVSQVRTLWINLRDNLGLSDEERSFLITRCLMNLYKSNYESPVQMLGKLKTSEELDRYETSWHQNVFVPAWQELDEKFEQYSVLWMNSLFQNIRNLEACYPLYPTEKHFLNYMNGLDLEGESLRLLSRFAVEKQRLEVGGELLPHLIQLYQWLHTHLSHLVTTDRAYNKLKIGQVIKLASRRVDPSLFELYKKVKGLYNKYVELVGGAIGQGACAAVRRGNRIYTIEDDLPLIHFLSDSEEEGEGNDWLYAVIKDIAENQNLFVHSLYTTVGNIETGEHPLSRLLTPESVNIFLAEANEHSCIIGSQQIIRGLNDFLRLIRARLNSSVAYRSAITPINAQSKMMSLSPDKAVLRPSLSFNLTHLQEDIVTHYLSGKPIIQDVDSLRIIFKFKEAKSSNITSRESDPMDTATDITALYDQLPPNCQIPLDLQHKQYLEYEFHSANYHSLTDIVIGLKTAIGLLIKVASKDSSLSIRNIEEVDLYHLLLSQYGLEGSGSHDSQLQTLNQIGIRNITDSQVRRLSLTKLPLLFSTLVLFVGWVKDGLYDFSSLPLALKVHLQETDCLSLNLIPAKYSGNNTHLLTELKSLIDVLLHTEPHFVKEVNNLAHKPIITVLNSLQLVTDTEKLPKLIPNTIFVHHYVQLRMTLRKLTSLVEQIVAMETSIDDATSQRQWNEMVDDLWSNALPHLRDQGFAFVDPTLLMNSSTDRYGFYGDDSDEDTDSEFGGDLNKDTSEGIASEDGSLELLSMDYNDPLLYQEQSYYPSIVPKPTITPDMSVRDTIKQGLEDHTIRSELLKIINKKRDIEQLAKDWSPQMVSQFLEVMGKKELAKVFLKEEINGLRLLSAERDVYEALGVKSDIECAEIGVLFKRELLGVTIIYCTISELMEQSGNKLETHSKTLINARVDVDMLVYAQQNGFLNELLKEIGIVKPLERNRFTAVLRTVSEKTAASSSEATLRNEQEYIAYSTPV